MFTNIINIYRQNQFSLKKENNVNQSIINNSKCLTTNFYSPSFSGLRQDFFHEIGKKLQKRSKTFLAIILSALTIGTHSFSHMRAEDECKKLASRLVNYRNATDLIIKRLSNSPELTELRRKFILSAKVINRLKWGTTISSEEEQQEVVCKFIKAISDIRREAIYSPAMRDPEIINTFAAVDEDARRNISSDIHDTDNFLRMLLYDPNIKKDDYVTNSLKNLLKDEEASLKIERESYH